MSEPWQHFYQSQRLRLAYWTWGSAANPPLILVHGGRDHSRNWDRVAEAFRDEYHVVACDLRGHGDSQWATGAHYGLGDHVLTSSRSSTCTAGTHPWSATPSAGRSRC